MIKILQADDHPLFREGFRYLLKQLDPEVITLEAGTLEKTLDILTRYEDIDLVLLDLAMPGMDGFNGYHAVEECNPAIPIVIISASEEPKDVRTAMALGAAGYIPKSSTTQSMIDALKLVISGGTYRPKIVQSEIFNHPLLTNRQLEVLKLMAEGFSNKQIANQLSLSESTVKHHVSAVLNHLEVENRTQAVLRIKEGRELG